MFNDNVLDNQNAGLGHFLTSVHLLKLVKSCGLQVYQIFLCSIRSGDHVRQSVAPRLLVY